MTISDLVKLLRAKMALIAGVFFVSITAGMIFFSIQPELYEVSTLIDARSGPYGEALPEIARTALESGVLDAEIARKAGLSGPTAIPKLHSGVAIYSGLLKVYTFVPVEKIGGAKVVLHSAVEVVNDEFMGDKAETSRPKTQVRRELKIKMISSPAASSLPAGPSWLQAAIAFGLLGLFSGLAAAMWAAERESSKSKGGV